MPPELLGIISGVTALFLSFKIFFDDFDEFVNCLRFWFQPDIISIFRGESFDDFWREIKLLVWAALGAASGYAVYTGLVKLLSREMVRQINKPVNGPVFVKTKIRLLR